MGRRTRLPEPWGQTGLIYAFPTPLPSLAPLKCCTPTLDPAAGEDQEGVTPWLSDLSMIHFHGRRRELRE